MAEYGIAYSTSNENWGITNPTDKASHRSEYLLKKLTNWEYNKIPYKSPARLISAYVYGIYYNIAWGSWEYYELSVDGKNHNYYFKQSAYDDLSHSYFFLNYIRHTPLKKKQNIRLKFMIKYISRRIMTNYADRSFQTEKTASWT